MNSPYYILLIDDDQDEHEIFEAAITEAYPGTRCEFHYDILSAVEKLNQKNDLVPDFIFMDWNMPAMDGEEGLQALNHFSNLNTDVFILSGMTGLTRIQMQAKRFGVRKVLSKQNTVALLVEELKAAINAALAGKAGISNPVSG